VNPNSSCPHGTDTIDLISDKVTHVTGTPLTGCEMFSPAEQIIAADTNGEADGYFVDGTECRFSQIPAQPGVAAPSPVATGVARIVSRDPAGSLFRIDNAKAACTLPSGKQENLCGKATIYDGVALPAMPSQMIVSCSTDPYIQVAVYRGDASIRLNGGTPVPVAANEVVRIDPISAAMTRTHANFSRTDAALFEVQSEALAIGLTISDYYRQLVAQLRFVPGSDSIVAPDKINAKYPGSYGSPTLMCQIAAQPAVFFPQDVFSKLPAISGAACAAPRALVYGAAIYRPADLVPVSDYLEAASGGSALKHFFFAPAIPISSGTASAVTLWNGGFDTKSSLSVIGKQTYVARFLYTIGEDPTPNIATVALTIGP
jgi:hypothetical protein